MKNILQIIKKWWIIAFVFLGLRSKDDLKLINKENRPHKEQAKEIVLDEFEINTYHS